MHLVVSLRLRNYARLENILQHGGRVSRDEMERQFLPPQSDYDQLVAWFKSQGLVVTQADSRHTHVVVQGTAQAMAAAFQVQMSRVATPQGEFVGAVTTPSLPAELTADVIGIAGLQPFTEITNPQTTLIPAVAHPSRAIPADLAAAYHVPANLNGAGQTIAVFGSDIPLQSDLNAFFAACGIAGAAPTINVVMINGGPTVTGPAGGGFGEVTMDCQWAAGLAPAATLVMYAVPGGGSTDFLATCSSILSTGGVNLLTSSFSNPETSLAPATLQACSQALAQMAAEGITVFHGAGDSGGYAGSTLPEYPTTDPYVFALGGTSQVYDASWNLVSESAWADTGGGYSTYFPTPAWQQIPSVPANVFRAVPDAAAPSPMFSASGTEFGLVIENGAQLGVGGDSHCGPVWAGLSALMNQARAKAGLPTIGLLAPKIYPLIGTSAFTDITTGNNGVYNAGPGYDLCTGVGVPNVTNLLAALASEPTVTIQPGSQTALLGSTLVLDASGTGTPAPTYQWYFNGTALAGATSARLVITAVAAANAGIYFCQLINSVATVSTQSAVVTVISSATPGHLANLSVLSQASTASPLTLGFVAGPLGGSGPLPLLLRASGPALTNFGITGVLADPLLTLYQNGAVLGGDDNWGTNATQVQAADLLTGAFALATGSLDAAMVISLGPSGYSIVVTGNQGTAGNTIAEVYDAAAIAYMPNATHLINLSCLGQVSPTSSLSAGFVITGATSRTVLVRATGPALSAFGVPSTLLDPSIALHGTISGTDTIMAADSGWAGDPQLVAAAAEVQAFPIADPNSQDSAVLITLAPGNYTAIVSSPGGNAGAALVEVYDVP